MPHDRRFKLNKVSDLITSQLPDFVRSDYDLFTSFVRDYYKFLEAGAITYQVEPDYLAQELNDSAYILQEGVLEEDFRFVTENVVQYQAGETITGQTSGAIAEVLFDDLRTQKIFVTNQTQFITGETLVGSNSGLTATMLEYRANPVQNIQQLVDYFDSDNTIYDFLEKLKDAFLAVLPSTYTSDVSRRLLIKHVKDLYAAKGTPEATKLFLRILLDEEADIRYPNENVLRVSGGNLENKTILRCASVSGSDGLEAEGQPIRGFTSEAVATVSKVVVFPEGTESVIEMIIEDQVGEFIDGETLECTSTITDRTIRFTVKSILSGGTITSGGLLYGSSEPTVTEADKGNGFGKLLVDEVSTGSISSVFVDDGGTGYKVGDTLYFTNPSDDVETAKGFVSALLGGFQLEDGTGSVLRETGTNRTEEPFNIALEQNEEYAGPFHVLGTAESNGQLGSGKSGYFYPLYLDYSSAGGTISDGVVTGAHIHTFIEFPGVEFWMPTATQTHAAATLPINESSLRYPVTQLDKLLIDGTDASSTDAGFFFETEIGEVNETLDLFYSTGEQLLQETGTDTAVNATSIYKVQLQTGGAGYTALPSIQVESSNGSGAKLLALTNDIGVAKSTTVDTFGFEYNQNDLPEIQPRAHFILKDVTGTFGVGNSLTTHTGSVLGWDSSKNQLDVTIDDSSFIQMEAATFNLPFVLEEEQGAELLTGNRMILEDIILEANEDENNNVLLDGSAFASIPSRFIRVSVKALTDPNDPNKKTFYLNGVSQREFVIESGNTYYFDLSDSSLFNSIDSLQYNFKLTTTNTDSGEYTTGVTNSDLTVSPETNLLIRPGEEGAFLKLEVTDTTPDLYYYSPNYNEIGGRLRLQKFSPIVEDEGYELRLDNTLQTLDFILLEDGTGKPNGALLNEQGTGRIVAQTSILNAGGGVVENANGKIDFDATLVSTTGQISSLLLETGGDILLETFGNFLVLDATDANGTDNSDRILSEEDIDGDGFIIMDGTDSSANNSGKRILHQDDIDFVGDEVVITDSGGATGTVILGDIAKIDSKVSTVSDPIQRYIGATSLIGEDIIRLQDSFFYQQFSYEVRIGESTTNYLNELKRAVHPAGFAPFGRVTVATQISAALSATRSLSDETRGQESFSPFLASVLEQIFDEVVRRRHAVVPDISSDGHFNDFLTQETGHILGDGIILDGTDGSQTNAGDDLLTEDNQQITLEDGLTIHGTEFILYHDGDTGNASDPAGGRSLLESSSVGLAGDKELAFIKTVKITVSAEPNEKPRDLLTVPSFGFFADESSILLEDSDGNGYSDGFLVADGFEPIPDIAFLNFEDDGFFLLENENGAILLEDSIITFDANRSFQVVGVGEKFRLETGGESFTEQFTFSQLGDVTFQEIERPSAFLLEQDGDIPASTFVDKIQLEQDDVTFIALELGSIDTGTISEFSVSFLGGTGHTHQFLNVGTSLSTISSPVGLAGSQTNDDLNKDSGSSGAVSGTSSTLSDVFDLRDDTGTFDFIDLVLPLGYVAGSTPVSIEGFLQLEEIDVGDTRLSTGQQDINQAFAEDVDNMVLEDNGIILLDGTDGGFPISADDGDRLLMENGKFMAQEVNGNIVFESYSALDYGQLQLEDGSGFLRAERTLAREPADGIAQEEGTPDFENSRIVFNGTDASGTDANDIVLQEQEIIDRDLVNEHFLLETTFIYPTTGQTPFANVSINKDSDVPTRVKKLAGQPVVRGADVSIVS